MLRAPATRVPGLSPEPQQWIGDIGRADLVDRALGLVVEADAWAFHALVVAARFPSARSDGPSGSSRAGGACRGRGGPRPG